MPEIVRGAADANPDSVPPTRVAVMAGSGGVCLEAAATWADRLGLPLVDRPYPDYDLLLVWTGKRLELRDNRDSRIGPVFADFTARASRPALSRRQPFARAIGRKAHTVVDATAGLAQDAFLLAGLGYEVTGIERSAVVAALVEDGLLRAPAAQSRLRVVCGEAAALLPTLAPAPDVIYLDPMFPPKRRKSAAVRKEMHMLRALVGEDSDATELFAVSLRCARQRVVVKRPDDAAPLAPRPAVSYTGRLVRYDVYLPARL
jgi:16S rRNA (guanine1516-N2)-methyltransferase